MEKIVIKGRGALEGTASGPAIVFPDSIAGNSGALGDVDGVVYEKGNINYGISIKNAILVVPCAKGSNGFSAHFKGALIAGVKPAGWVSTKGGVSEAMVSALLGGASFLSSVERGIERCAELRSELCKNLAVKAA